MLQSYQLQLKKKKESLKAEVVVLKSQASNLNVGETFVNMRLELYELSIVPSLLASMKHGIVKVKVKYRSLNKYKLISYVPCWNCQKAPHLLDYSMNLGYGELRRD